MSSSKKLTCKGTSQQVVICLRTPSPPRIMFGVVYQFCRFWFCSDIECKTPAEYGLQQNPIPPPHFFKCRHFALTSMSLIFLRFIYVYDFLISLKIVNRGWKYIHKLSCEKRYIKLHIHDEQILDICKREKYSFVLILLLNCLHESFENTTPTPFLL